MHVYHAPAGMEVQEALPPAVVLAVPTFSTGASIHAFFLFRHLIPIPTPDSLFQLPHDDPIRTAMNTEHD